VVACFFFVDTGARGTGAFFVATGGGGGGRETFGATAAVTSFFFFLCAAWRGTGTVPLGRGAGSTTAIGAGDGVTFFFFVVEFMMGTFGFVVVAARVGDLTGGAPVFLAGLLLVLPEGLTDEAALVVLAFCWDCCGRCLPLPLFAFEAPAPSFARRTGSLDGEGSSGPGLAFFTPAAVEIDKALGFLPPPPLGEAAALGVVLAWCTSAPGIGLRTCERLELSL